MRRTRHFLPLALLALLAVFAVGRLGFIFYNGGVETLTPWQVIRTLMRALPLDLRTSALLLLLPALCTLQQRVSLRLLLVPYFVAVSLAVASVVTADTVMYEFWKFKLSEVVLSYAASPEGMTSSVSTSFIVSRISVGVVYALLVAFALVWITPARAERQWAEVGATLVLALLPVGVGTCYGRGQSLFRNHASTNPLYAFAASFRQDRHYDYFPDEECGKMLASLYPPDTEDIADTLLRTDRPNVLLLQMESFGGRFVEELGGVPGVAPNLSRLIPEGVFFDGYYSNSFRTDRGTVSLQSGMVSLPTVSLMRESHYHHLLPSLPRRLGESGYDTHYFYAGEMTNMGKGVYLADMGFGTLHDIGAFAPEDRDCAWGAHDGTAAARLLQLLATQDTVRPWYFTFQMLSSHEPWEVPYHRLGDRRLNAFAYTDHCVGRLVDSLRATPLWDNLLIMVVPDHGYLYEQTYEDPSFFHSPMLWLGGAIRRPRRIHTLMNQSDVAATLLAQLGIRHTDFPWSRNVLSKRYTYPFAYCNYPAGIMLRDSTGVSVYDISASRPITSQPKEGDGERIRRAKAILQASHVWLRAGDR